MSALAAQGDNPVRWRTIVKSRSRRKRHCHFRALISPGWHLYGLELPEGGLKATNFDLAGSKGREIHRQSQARPHRAICRRPVVRHDTFMVGLQCGVHSPLPRH